MFIQPGETVVETKKCSLSAEEFSITDKDIAFLDKVSPIYGGKKYTFSTPTLCPSERQKRRLCIRNDRNLYQRKCDFTGKQIISMHSPDTEFPVYDQTIWWSDDWSAHDHGRKMDFSKSFFENYRDLQSQVPRISMASMGNQNSEYCAYLDYSKNCYLFHTGNENEDSHYGSYNFRIKNSLDMLWSDNCDQCYNLTHCSQCYGCQNSIYLKNCRDCLFSRELTGCQNCFGCWNLNNKNYHFFNEELSKEEYEKRLEEVRQKNLEEVVRKKFQQEISSIGYKHLQNLNCENVIGDYLTNCKNLVSCFDSKDCEDCKNCSYLIKAKNCQDWDCFGIDSSFCYEMSSCAYNHHQSMSCTNCWQGSEACLYCDLVQNGTNCFGCISLKKAKNCILNTSYSQKEYEDLCSKIADQMKETNDWGEFFPQSLSPFGYNETVAYEYFPLEKGEVLQQGFNWKDEDETSSYHGEFYEPSEISQYDERVVGVQKARGNCDECIKGILKCSITGKPFKIIKQELAFYIENGLPLPRKCPDQRHAERMGFRNPRKLWESECHKCSREIQTTYAPSRPEKVLCEKCYREEIY